MPPKKSKNTTKSDWPSAERDDDTSSMASVSDASPTHHSDRSEAENSPNIDLMEKLDRMGSDFANRFDGVLEAIRDVKRDVKDFSGRMEEAEKRISEVEDTLASEKAKTETLVQQVALLTNKLDELENRSRRSNLRLINMPEKVEKDNAVTFLEKWLPEVLGPGTFPSPPIIERAHRLPSRAQYGGAASPRVIIMKFLNFQDQVRVLRAARAKGKVLYRDQEVKFFPDISAELHRQRRRFDGVKQQLRVLNIRFGIIYPAKLRLTINGQVREFENPAEAEKFVQGLPRAGDTT